MQRRFHGFDAFLRVHEGLGAAGRISGIGLGENHECEGLEAPFPGQGSPRTPLWPVGKVEVFQPGLGLHGEDAVPEFVGELPLFLDGVQDGLPPLFQVLQVEGALLDLPDLHLVEAAGGFFSVASDERNGGVLVQESGHGGHTACGQSQLLGQDGNGVKGVGVGHGSNPRMTSNHCLTGMAAHGNADVVSGRMNRIPALNSLSDFKNVSVSFRFGFAILVPLSRPVF